MDNLCNYSNLFGKPNEGLHSIRVGGFAFIDILLTIIIALLITRDIKKFIFVFLFLIVLSIGIHKLFCVNTALIKLLKL